MDVMGADVEYPEYLRLFSNQGEFRVQVNFKDCEGSVASSTMLADEVQRLIDPRTGSFFIKMYIDDHLFEVYGYEIDPIKKLVKIKVRL